MTSPYRIEPPFYVSFSGGRTSGYMVKMILDACGGEMPVGGYVMFANTGREHPATLDFVEEVNRRWCKVIWIEYIPKEPGYRLVNRATASMDGKPFAQLIAKRKYLPNPVARFCTSDLKVKPMGEYMSLLVGEDFTTVLGIRADEPRRVSRIKGDTTRDISLPLADAGVTREDVVLWWSRQHFDLQLPNDDPAYGNCDMCFLKSRERIERVMSSEPERAKWWMAQEDHIRGTFRKDRPTYAQMLQQVTVQGQLFRNTGEDDTLPCDCTE